MVLTVTSPLNPIRCAEALGRVEVAAAQAAPVVQGVAVDRAKLLFMASLLRERAGLWAAAGRLPPPQTASSAPAPEPAPAPAPAPAASRKRAASPVEAAQWQVKLGGAFKPIGPVEVQQLLEAARDRGDDETEVAIRNFTP